MAKKARPIPLDMAVKKIERMMPLVRRDVLSALEVEAAMQSANDIVVAQDLKGYFYGAPCYNTVSQTMGIYLCVAVAKIFDVPKAKRGQSLSAKLNTSDVASLPLLLRLLQQKRCRAHFIASANIWNPRALGDWRASAAEVERNIDQALLLYRDTIRNEAAALMRVKEFRNWVVAHTLLKDRAPMAPQYNDIFRLIDNARDIYAHLAAAIASDFTDLVEREEERYRISKAFWEPALHDKLDAN